MKPIHCCAIATLVALLGSSVIGSETQAIANDGISPAPEPPLATEIVPTSPTETIPDLPAEPTPAPVATCLGESCVNQDPIEHGCDAQVEIESERVLTVYRWQDNWQPQEIVIQKLYSELCDANWTRAFVPHDTYLFIQATSLNNPHNNIHSNAHSSFQGLARAVGTGYFWFDSNMAARSTESRACTALIVTWWWFDRHCTESI